MRRNSADATMDRPDSHGERGGALGPWEPGDPGRLPSVSRNSKESPQRETG